MDGPLSYEEWLAEENDERLLEDANQRQIKAGRGKPARRCQIYLQTLTDKKIRIIKVSQSFHTTTQHSAITTTQHNTTHSCRA